MRSRVQRLRSAPWLLAATLLAVAPAAASAQYFGRNKVQYEDFDWRVLETQKFDVHFYPAESLAATDAGRMAERWYTRLSPLLRSTFDERSLIFYANSPDFQQTNVLSGFIDQGTGGVTESIRGRVIMPFQSTYAETDHVLGHELVHVFQYNIAFSGDPALVRGLGAVPLWVIEGMAEYLSVGRYDPLTAMWLRDAVLRDDLPTLTQLSRDPRYFPYRYGQAFWAWYAGIFGDAAVERVYRTSLRQGWEQALRTTTGRSADSLSAAWHRDIRAQYAGLLAGRTAPDSTGTRIVRGDPKDGQANVSPVVSPDGRYLAYFSSANLFGYSLFIADAVTGRRIKELSSLNRDPHFEAISFISSAGSWSPDSRQFAFVVYAEGDEEINIFDVERGDVVRRVQLTGVGAISDPAWSPDGRQLVVSGNAGGVSDLYLIDLATGNAQQLTSGRAAELQPQWSPDGRAIAYATDQGPGYDPSRLTFGEMRIALLDVATGQSRVLPGLGTGKHHNPQFSADGQSIYFIATPDGFANIFRTNLASGESFQVTNVATGVSGISRYSPALSVARSTGRLVFSVFEAGGFTIRGLEPAAAAGVPVPAATVARAALPPGGLLPPVNAATGTVARYLEDPTTGLLAEAGADSVRPYRSTLSLDYVGVPSAGFGVGGPFGAQVQGAVAATFADELNNRNVGAAVIAQGTLKDIGGQVYYLNRENRWGWLVGASRTPFLSLGYQVRPDVIATPSGDRDVVIEELLYVRQFFDQLSGGVQYPFSQTRRVEFNAGVQRYSTDIEADQLIYDAESGGIIEQRQGVNLTEFDRPAVTLQQGSVAYVGDYSFFGFTSPIAGGRYRFEVAPTFGDLTYQTALADYRRYYLAAPVTFAFRGMHFGRYGRDAENYQYLFPLFIGNPQFVRGYDQNSYDFASCTPGGGFGGVTDCNEFNQLLGSRMALASAEIRIPLLGTRQYGLFNVPFLPTDLNFFADAGVAWSSGERPRLAFERDFSQVPIDERVPVTSLGVSTRLNVLGYAVVELYYAWPFQRQGREGGVFGFQLAPGW